MATFKGKKMNIREKIKKAIADIGDAGRQVLEDKDSPDRFTVAMMIANSARTLLITILEEMEQDDQWKTETCETCDFRKGYACKYGPPGHNGKPTRMTLPPQIGTPPSFVMPALNGKGGRWEHENRND